MSWELAAQHLYIVLASSLASILVDCRWACWPISIRRPGP